MPKYRSIGMLQKRTSTAAAHMRKKVIREYKANSKGGQQRL